MDQRLSLHDRNASVLLGMANGKWQNGKLNASNSHDFQLNCVYGGASD
jgi:hypothetical protein